MTKKFKLTTEVKEFYGTKLFRIEALIDFGSVKAGDKGGYIEKEDNLSQEDNAWVSGDARVDHSNKYITISPVGSENGVLTAFRQKDGSVMVNRGCFSGTIDQFEKAVNKTHGDNGHGQIYKLAIEMIKKRLG